MITAASDRSKELLQTYWLASRGAQQMDLALRLTAAAESEGLRLLALKGISIADDLYGGVWNRPMADIDFLVVDTSRFPEAAKLARSLGLVETGASDHALVFKEPISGVVAELHISLTAAPGLFSIDPDALWTRREGVLKTPMFRLSAADLVVHLALHTAFQHGFAANEYHYGDFVRVLERLNPDHEQLLESARVWGALPALGAMVAASRRRDPDSQALAKLWPSAERHCPPSLARWIDSRKQMPPPAGVASLAFVRFELAPSKWRYLRSALFPKVIPGRSLERPTTLRRLANIADAALFSPPPPKGQAS